MSSHHARRLGLTALLATIACTACGGPPALPPNPGPTVPEVPDVPPPVTPQATGNTEKHTARLPNGVTAHVRGDSIGESRGVLLGVARSLRSDRRWHVRHFGNGWAWIGRQRRWAAACCAGNGRQQCRKPEATRVVRTHFRPSTTAGWDANTDFIAAATLAGLTHGGASRLRLVFGHMRARSAIVMATDRESLAVLFQS